MISACSNSTLFSFSSSSVWRFSWLLHDCVLSFPIHHANTIVLSHLWILEVFQQRRTFYMFTVLTLHHSKEKTRMQTDQWFVQGYRPDNLKQWNFPCTQEFIAGYCLSHKPHYICDERSDGKFSLKPWAFLGLLKNICYCVISCRRGNKLWHSLSLHRFINQLRMRWESERWILLIRLDWGMQCRLVVETAYLRSISHSLTLVLLPGLPAHPHPQHTPVLCKGECVQRECSCAAALPHPCKSWQ